MTRRDQIYKWCIYALGLFPIWVLDAFVLSRYPLLGITPTLLPLAVSAVAVLEGALPGHKQLESAPEPLLPARWCSK